MPLHTKNGKLTADGKLFYKGMAEFIAENPTPGAWTQSTERTRAKLIDFMLAKADEIGLLQETRSKLVVCYTCALRRCTPEQREKLLKRTSPSWNMP